MALFAVTILSAGLIGAIQLGPCPGMSAYVNGLSDAPAVEPAVELGLAEHPENTIAAAIKATAEATRG
jgi:hypothetical protein